jgi:hypothetical protein
MNTETAQKIKDKFIEGLNIAFKKLLIVKQKDDSDIVLYRNGKIVKIKAKDFKLEPEEN